MNLAKQGFQAYENSQNEGQNNGQQGHNAQGGGQFGVQGSAALNSNDNQGPSQGTLTFSSLMVWGRD
jgi:hypothetical protein